MTREMDDDHEMEDDLEHYRHTHESNTEWRLRRQFIAAHQDALDRNRLLCLANCFINVECYGCTYPEPVMLELRRLTMEMKGSELHEHRELQANKRAVKFVKGS